jgi:uncharacterized RDD family membrane protein YckC
MKYASTSKRVYATLIDYTLVLTLNVFYISVVGTKDDNYPGNHYEITGLPALVPLVFWVVYFVVTETYMGGTLGHQIFKLKVIPIDGGKAGFGQILVRRLFDAVEICWCFGLIAFFVVKTSPLHQRIGDMVARVRVIGAGDEKPEVVFDFEQSRDNRERN